MTHEPLWSGVRDASLEALIYGYLGRIVEPSARSAAATSQVLANTSPIDLPAALARSDPGWIVTAADRLNEVRSASGRVFVIGNGGSYDNARLIAHLLVRAGIEARTPGNDETLRRIAQTQDGFGSMFVDTLTHEAISASDLLISISGSGNSTNVVAAIEYSVARGAQVLGLGGRDGGRMAKIIGDEACFIAATECMEALEDIHPLVMAAVADLIETGTAPLDVESARESIERIGGDVLSPLATGEATGAICDLAARIERTIWNGGRIFLLGDPVIHPSVTHLDADWGRGMINQLPVRGPERISYTNVNSWMATGNDDGVDFWLVDEFARVQIREADVVIGVGSASVEPALSLVLDHAASCGIPLFLVGDPGTISLSATDSPGSFVLKVGHRQVDLVATTIAHLISRSVHDHLISPDGEGWRIRPLETEALPDDSNRGITRLLAGRKKTDRQATIGFEERLRSSGYLDRESVITWCYGKPFVVDDPKLHGLDRSYY